MLALAEATWAGVGALLLGLGSAFSGYAAIVTARKGRDEPTDESETVDGDGT